ncbi:MAG: type II secretion system F family protein [Pseudomonadota bacterium]
MAKFTYKARNRRGESLKGEIEADSEDAVAQQLINSELTPIVIEAAAESSPHTQWLQSLWQPGKVDADELALFSRQLYSLTRAGIPIIRALSSLSQSTRNPFFAEILQSITANLEAGLDLSTAFSRYSGVFPPLFISIIRVGESTGRLDDALLQLADHLELEKENRKRLKSALRYPTIVLAVMAIAIVVINLFVVPAFTDIFERSGKDLPLATQILLGLSNFMVDFWPHLLVVGALGAFGVKYWLSTETGRYQWDRAKLKIPLFGDIILRGTLGRFARSLGLASQSGVPLLQGLTVVAGTVDNAFLEERVLTMRAGIEHGESLTRTAAAAGMFTPLVLQMIAVGEETGAIDRQLLETAEHYEREVDYDIKTIGDAIEPIIIITLGVMVLILAMGIFLPMWDLSTTI